MFSMQLPHRLFRYNGSELVACGARTDWSFLLLRAADGDEEDGGREADRAGAASAAKAASISRAMVWRVGLSGRLCSISRAVRLRAVFDTLLRRWVCSVKLSLTLSVLQCRL